ncbi:MAG: hypothetical protein A3E98_02985 [Candidatus Doudnabacteria bacterium RIFCSPHIGHO2_12_FULL_48_11]|uniref:Four helix bundle protein n=1 Tax=Candidatus Doudnabacteria bacterium RIFCSPHIGHO2_01_FULL_46_24 TaxID=1817825 RepID=A0A1F5NTA4_9BACT|nr:MAG: hypothetical protein A2720_00340 [Candidatus Doudnabacteria bacterium RIFCSPHIGHO2_01_FULL_46_24]OGE95344.1 MAG: hypothetical protein A3E98_02985 [Candidatus Doudnabacteria bacterium RIFCSPHIGHO2_12_FULL_48_11]
MLKPQKNPVGYKKLLAYQKAAVLQEFNLRLTDLFPHSFAWLKEQMDKSGRSGTKNIIEGWKRNTTAEYYTFLGFSIGAVEELKDDSLDIAKGLYKPLMEIPGLWKRGKGNNGSKGGRPLTSLTPSQASQATLPVTPFTPSQPNQPVTPFTPLTPSQASQATLPVTPFTPSQPNQPLTPFTPLTPFLLSDLEQLRFYPLDPFLPPIVQLYLKSKETLMLLHKLQQSLEQKMSQDGTMSIKDKFRLRQQQEKEADDWARQLWEKTKGE